MVNEIKLMMKLHQSQVSKTAPKNNLETNEKEILRERIISPEVRDKIIDDLRLKKGKY